MSFDWKAIRALFRTPATWEDGSLVQKPTPRLLLGPEIYLKGFRVVTGGQWSVTFLDCVQKPAADIIGVPTGHTAGSGDWCRRAVFSSRKECIISRCTKKGLVNHVG